MDSAIPTHTYCFDLDGNSCSNTYGAYERAEPYPWAIERVNALARAGHRIIVFSARGSSTGIDWESTTREQLARWSVSYDELVLGKPTADVFVDDRALTAEAWRLGHVTNVPDMGSSDPFAHAAQAMGILGHVAAQELAAVEVGRTYGAPRSGPMSTSTT